MRDTSALKLDGVPTLEKLCGVEDKVEEDDSRSKSSKAFPQLSLRRGVRGLGWLTSRANRLVRFFNSGLILDLFVEVLLLLPE